MNDDATILDAMQRLIDLFAPRCADRSTLDELRQMLADDRSWPAAHDLFDRIRHKTLEAERQHDQLLEMQYLFEEICAKTLYNLSYPRGPFDADSPYWIVPNAFALARRLGIDNADILRIIAA